MKILFLSRWFPYPPDNGSKIRIFNLIRYLSSLHEVDLVSFTSEPVASEKLAAMRDYCCQVETVDYRPFQPHGWRAMIGFFSRRPRSVIDTYSPPMRDMVQRMGRAYGYDLVIASQIDMAAYALLLSGVTKVFEEVELTKLYDLVDQGKQAFRKLRNLLTWYKTAVYVSTLVRQFEGCTVVSERERQFLLERVPGYQSVAVVPNGVDFSYCAAATAIPQPDSLIYSGALTYSANFDAMDYFLHEVFPLIQAARPCVKLFITGKTDGVPVHRLPAHPGVVFTGYLDDVRPAVAGSWASVVPLRVGGGTRLKILEALALGTPVVATAKGAEGLDLAPENEILIADSPADMARTILHLLGDPALRETLSLNGRRAVKARYDWPMIGQQLNHFIEQTVANGHKR